MIVGHRKTGDRWPYLSRVDESGMAAVFELQMGSGGKKTEIARFPLEFDNQRFSYYVDADGDVSRCKREYAKQVERAGWISGPRLTTTIVAERSTAR